MYQFKTFKVIPDVPDKLKGLVDIAYNVWLSWTPDAIKLFLRMDEELWNKTHHNPVMMLGEISQTRLEELAKDESYVVEVARVRDQLEKYITNVKKHGCNGKPCNIAYFSLEYGLSEALPIYSGGLGVLSGDHIKAASDIGLNLTGIGLLYTYGYFQQYLNQDGWQQDVPFPNDFHNMQVREVMNGAGTPLEIDLDLPDRTIGLKIWKLAVGRVTIYFMDSNIDRNDEADRKLTSQLYGGDREMRIKQEIILGIGGVKLLDRLGIHADVIHMNEGHSSFAIFERARQLMEKHAISFDEAMEITRKTSVFTTHTPVPAGNDEFHPELVRKYFRDYSSRLGISVEQFLGFGRINPSSHSENFSMPVLAIKYSAYVNGVSKLHAKVAREMWHKLWPAVHAEHVPIEGITNGVHLPTWLSFEMFELFRRYLGSNWQEKQDSPDLWAKIHNIPDPELWRVRCLRRRRMIYFIRERLQKQLMEKGASTLVLDEAQEALNPEALTIGFARRFATYKRGDLIFRDIDRLLKLLNNEDYPIQLVIAGKAHPQDHAGKEIIKNVIHHIGSNNLLKKIVFIENYEMNVARYMVQGVDVWLNNPLRPHEASGTSGMKAVVNGVLNLSVLDGWWDEAYSNNPANGWAIGGGETYDDREYQDEVESKDIYSILEKGLVPLYYDQDQDGLPRRWIKMIKNGFDSITPYFNTQRMVKEYYDEFYKKAGCNYTILSKDGFKNAKDLVAWKNRIRGEFHNIKIENVTFDGTRIYKIRDKFDIEVGVSLGNLKPEEVKVDIYFGKIAPGDRLEHSSIENLREFASLGDGRYTFSGKLVCKESGNLGFKVRITPYHPLVIDPYEMNMVVWD